MEQEEYILKSNWDKFIYPYSSQSPISTYDYAQLISWLKPFNDKPAKAQEITDNIIEEYFE